MADNAIQVKSIEFAKRIVELYKYLKDDKKEFVMSRQILRSATSIGANIVEAECGISRKDFLAKMYIAYKESAETLYWLELLHCGHFITEDQYNSLTNDCSELKRILSAITKTTKTT